MVLEPVAVVLGVVPNKGITLTFVSYGGSSLAVSMFLIGLVLNVSRRPDRHAAPDAAPREVRKKRHRVRVVIA